MQPYAGAMPDRVATAPGQATLRALPVVRAYLWIANRPALACAVVFFLSLGIRTALLPWMHVPKPSAHDEYSYLLAADTYASGRLANPPHRFWQHFETFHVIQQPTYASKFPPLFGLVLAFGERFFGEPWIGVLLGTALMCAALCWMLQAWLPPGAALLGALLVVLRIGTFDYWMNSYYGGGPIPAIGGALVFGALGRILFHQQWGSMPSRARVDNPRNSSSRGLTLGAGLAILLASRPYDFAVVGVVCFAALTWALWRRKLPRASALRVCLAAAPILAIAAAGMAYNNFRVTGNAFLLPYQLHDQQYAVTSVFLWSTPHAEPVYHHEVMRGFWADWFVKTVQAARADPLGSFCTKLTQLYEFFFGFWPLLILPLAWPYRLKTTQERLVVVLLGISMIALVAPLAGIMAHYVASIAGLIYLRFMQTLTRLSRWRPSGRPIGFALAALFVTPFVYHFGSQALRLRTGEELPRHAIARDQVIQELQKQPGPKLVLVRYTPRHYIHEDWVYNTANIDSQPIVWAREMGADQDLPLIEYFRNRQVWLLEPDQSPLRLGLYSAPANHAASAR